MDWRLDIFWLAQNVMCRLRILKVSKKIPWLIFWPKYHHLIVKWTDRWTLRIILTHYLLLHNIKDLCLSCGTWVILLDRSVGWVKSLYDMLWVLLCKGLSCWLDLFLKKVMMLWVAMHQGIWTWVWFKLMRACLLAKVLSLWMQRLIRNWLSLVIISIDLMGTPTQKARCDLIFSWRLLWWLSHEHPS